MNGGVSDKEKAMDTAFDFKGPCSKWRQTFESNAQTPLQYSDDSCTSDNSNNHRSGDSDSEEGDGHDSGISSNDEDDRTTYTAVQLTNDSLDSQRYTGICIPTTIDDWVGENNHQTGLSGNLPDGSNNPQIFKSDPLQHGSNGLGYNFNDYSQATCSKLSASDQEEGQGYSLGDSCENKENLTKGAGGSNQTFEDEQKSSEFPKVDNWLDSDGNSEDSSDYGDDDVGHYDTDCGKRYSHLSFHDENTNIIKKDSFSLAQIELNKAEEEKYESIWQEMDKILSNSDEAGECEEDDIGKLKGRLDEVISQALEQGIMFTFPYKDGESFVDHIINTIQALYWVDSTENFRLLEEKKILQVISEGATLNKFTKENHDNYVNCIYREKEILSQRNKNILGLNNLAYESIVNKSKQTQDVLGLDKDNGYFCIEYSQDSIVEVAEILNNEKAKDLNLRVGILKIGESIVRVENVEEIGGKRNYMDVSKGGIEMSFTTEVGKISIYLSPSEKDSNKIKVEVDGENRARLNS
ncbi:hypothetical protein [Wolbachia pipientis]|uniref:hypothetical protein n=1 Tax=Wolbachia pipientis TaxID=955 RepID=UPI0021C96E59|nr:hypothetical protein [Wolbachia pipientis]